MDYNKLFQSKTFKIALWSIAGLVVFLFVLKLGMFLGFRKANFSYKWGENYHRNFAGPRSGFFGEFSGGDFIDAHGVFGQIIAIDPSTDSGQAGTIILKGRADTEKIVLIGENTVIKRFRDSVKFSELKIDDFIVVIGEPNDEGQIEAKLIRLSPPLPTPPAKWEGAPFKDSARRPMKMF